MQTKLRVIVLVVVASLLWITPMICGIPRGNGAKQGEEVKNSIHRNSFLVRSRNGKGRKWLTANHLTATN